MKLDRVKLEKIIYEDDKTITYIFSKPQGLRWEPGANIHLAFNDFIKEDQPDKSLVRHMSLNKGWDQGVISITTRFHDPVSPYKARLQKLGLGDEMTVFGVNNKLPMKRLNKPLILISMGVGLSTFLPYIQAYKENPEGITSLLSLQIDRGNHNLYKEVLDFDYQYYYKVRQDLYRAIKDTFDPSGIYYIVGSNPFLREITSLLLGHGLKKNQICLDKKDQVYKTFDL